MEDAMEAASILNPTVPKAKLLPYAMKVLSERWNSLKVTDSATVKKYEERSTEKNARPDVAISDLNEKDRTKLIRSLDLQAEQLLESYAAAGISSHLVNVDEATDSTHEVVKGPSAIMMKETLAIKNVNLRQCLAMASQMIRNIPDAPKRLNVESKIASEDYKQNIKKIVNSALVRAGKHPVTTVNWKLLTKFKIGKLGFHITGWPERIPFQSVQKVKDLEVLNPLLKNGSIRIEWGRAKIGDGVSDGIDNDVLDVGDDEMIGDRVNSENTGGPGKSDRVNSENTGGRGESDVEDLEVGIWIAFNNKFHGKYGNGGDVEWIPGESQIDLMDGMARVATAGLYSEMYRVWVVKLCKAKQKAGVALNKVEAVYLSDEVK
ncbi:hypothetical protein HDU99_003920 [Rhizoclosmatium hyalinum]|nr:hypothetical protein HDU99_003920 [Rhizoclosmatium hyalinum]